MLPVDLLHLPCQRNYSKLPKQLSTHVLSLGSGEVDLGSGEVDLGGGDADLAGAGFSACVSCYKK